MVCSVCGQESYQTYALEGGELCRDCLLDAAEDPKVIADKLPAFIAQHQKEFVGWVCDTSAGDCYDIQRFVDRAKDRAVKEWISFDPQAYFAAIRDFRESKPGEWEEFLENLERSA